MPPLHSLLQQLKSSSSLQGLDLNVCTVQKNTQWALNRLYFCFITFVTYYRYWKCWVFKNRQCKKSKTSKDLTLKGNNINFKGIDSAWSLQSWLLTQVITELKHCCGSFGIEWKLLGFQQEDTWRKSSKTPPSSMEICFPPLANTSFHTEERKLEHLAKWTLLCP